MSTVTKKRKRDADAGTQVSLSLSSLPTTQVGPVLVSFPALRPPEKTPFQCYVEKPRGGTKEAETSKPFASQNTILAGESESVEFVSASQEETPSSGCNYYVAVYNKRTNTATLRQAPLHVTTRQVKALKNLEPIQSASIEERVKQRKTLGETFGTKKAKAAIRAQERNRVDIDAMKGVTDHIQDRIQENTFSLPTKEEAKVEADKNRLIPPFNADAERPGDVYILSDIIPEAEFNALNISSFLQKGLSDKDRQAFLPYTRSNWINLQLRLLFSSGKPSNKSDVKILWYISTMIAFKNASKTLNDKDKLYERLKSVPSIVVDGLLSRFTESSRDSTKLQITSQMETKLLAYMFALCLRVGDYAVDCSTIAQDLSMSAAKVNTLFKSLGCKIDNLKPHEIKALGLPDKFAESKRAILRVPLEFPTARVKRQKR